MGTITYQPLDVSHSNIIGGSLDIYHDLINFWVELIKTEDDIVEPLVGSHLNLICLFSRCF